MNLKFKDSFRFLLSFLFLLLSLLAVNLTSFTAEDPLSPVMLDASSRTAAAFSAIKEERLARGHELSLLDDPNQTGMIGEPYTEITTTLGNLESKRSSTNPNIAAMIVKMLDSCGVSAGDTVAVNLSSSFPCANLAVLCAMDSMNVNGIVINSVGASTYGANLPDFTWLDMEHLLLEKGLITNHSAFFSMGGSNDQGKEMPEDVKSEICSRLSGYGLTFLSYDNLEDNLAVRMAIYEKAGEISCMINAGGNLLAFAGGTELISSENGILLPGDSKNGADGLIPRFLERDVPVIHLLNMKTLLPAYGLPVDPVPLPAVGEGDVYRSRQTSKPLIIFLIAANLGYLAYAVKKYPHRKFPL